MEGFKERLKELREEKGLNQTEVAKAVNLTQTTISGYEIGYREPDFQTLKKLCDFFEVSAGYLLGFEEI
ncbi:MAG: helix-turn-helix transcriptional regulator [Defluviitaleaceae bacterium]|nr:helix-turn-helix transcriptional regulator [Defluviitaleaceae bacterium]